MKKLGYRGACLIGLCTVLPGAVQAGVSAQEAAQLKGKLTPLGAERAGSQDGLVPAWTGGYTETAPGYKSGDPRPDPFAGEKPLFSVTGANMKKYAAMLTEGQATLLQRYPDYRLDVFPSHRTASAPQSVYDATFRNATTATETNDGNTMANASGGIPFPIAKNGTQAMWNHLDRWKGEANYDPFKSILVDSGGRVTLAAESVNYLAWPFYYAGDDNPTWTSLNYQVVNAPAYKAGEAILAKEPQDPVGVGLQAWQYLVGQRRVRRAPNLAYDTPNTVTSGISFFDEPFGFLGPLDHYQWKILGKEEMIIPYNDNGMFLIPTATMLKVGHLSSDGVRWEVHRVWVVEATLAPGKRHVLPRRKFYLDEDTWQVVLADGWDAQGQLWHISECFPAIHADYPGTFATNFSTMDLLKSSYDFATNGESHPQYQKVAHWPSQMFTPEYVASKGVR